MPRYDCPSCGNSFNGKKCRNCGYETFNEEIAHRLHVHKGEPLVIRETTRKPIPTADPFGCPPVPQKRRPAKKRKVRPLGVVMLVLFLLGPIMDATKNIAEKFGDTLSYITSPTSEPLPQDDYLLYSGNGIRVSTPWNPETGFTSELPLNIFNDGKKRIFIWLDSLTVNDFCLDEYAYLSGEIKPRQSECLTLYLNEDALNYCGISTVSTYGFRLGFYEAKNSDQAVLTDFICVPFPDTELKTQPNPADDGAPLFEDENVRLVYRGYIPPKYDSASLSDIPFLIFIENKSDRNLVLRSDDVLANGSACDLWIYSPLPAHTKRVIQCSCCDLPVEKIEDLKELTISLLYRDDDWNETSFSVILPVESQGQAVL